MYSKSDTAAGKRHQIERSPSAMQPTPDPLVCLGIRDIRPPCAPTVKPSASSRQPAQMGLGRDLPIIFLADRSHHALDRGLQNTPARFCPKQNPPFERLHDLLGNHT